MINDRVEELIKSLCGGNKSAFAQRIGVSPSVVENIVGTRRGKPSYDVLEKIVCAFANISSEWLLTGAGDMIKRLPPESSAPVQLADDQIVRMDRLLAIIERQTAQIESLTATVKQLTQERIILQDTEPGKELEDVPQKGLGEALQHRT